MNLPNYEEVKDQMVAQRYRVQETLVRCGAIEACTKKNLALELYAGVGGNTKLYKECFKEVITNDINSKSIATHTMSAMDFCRKVLPVIGKKIDLVDFDCYGSPSREIEAFFEERDSFDCPIIVTFADGAGLWMKKARKADRTERIQRRYLLPLDYKFDTDHPWRGHIALIDEFMNQIALKYNMKVINIISMQMPFKNYVIGAYKFT